MVSWKPRKEHLSWRKKQSTVSNGAEWLSKIRPEKENWIKRYKNHWLPSLEHGKLSDGNGSQIRGDEEEMGTQFSKINHRWFRGLNVKGETYF